MVALACAHLCCLVCYSYPHVCAWLQMYPSTVQINCYICDAKQSVAVPCTQAEFDRLKRRVVALEDELAVLVRARSADAANARVLAQEVVPQLVVVVAPTVLPASSVAPVVLPVPVHPPLWTTRLGGVPWAEFLR